MFIKVDYRESDFMTTMNLLFKEHNHQIELENLYIGDMVLLNNEQNEKIIFERKSLYDLASSIKDGRYKEQSFRLNESSVHNHNIIYIIEGDFEKYNPKKGRMDKKTLYSALVTLNYFKGFSTIRTKNINETCELIINYADKLEKESKKKGYYEKDSIIPSIININTTNGISDSNDSDNNKNETNNESNNETNNESNNESNNGPKYCEVIKKQKKDHITIDNIGEIMLSCIPGVSSKSAIAIMNEYKTINNLIIKLKENDKCLDNFKMKDSNNITTRKINKTCIENIKKFIRYSD